MIHDEVGLWWACSEDAYFTSLSGYATPVHHNQALVQGRFQDFQLYRNSNSNERCSFRTLKSFYQQKPDVDFCGHLAYMYLCKYVFLEFFVSLLNLSIGGSLEVIL